MESFLDESGATARYVDNFSDEVRVYAHDKVLHVEIDIFDAVIQLRCKVIAQVIGIQMI